MKTKKMNKAKEKFTIDVANAFAVLGDGWMHDPIMNNFYSRCIKAGKQYADAASRKRAVDFLDWILNTNEPRLIGKVGGLCKHIDITPIDALYDDFNQEDNYWIKKLNIKSFLE